MKKLTMILSLSALGAAMAFAQAPTKASDTAKMPAADSATAAELKQIENDWAAAEKAKDSVKLSAILDDTWVELGWDGKIVDKAKALAELKTGSVDSIGMGPMTVRVFGNTAVVTGSDTEKSTENGKDTSGSYIWTDVFVKTNGKWKAVASQITKVPK